MSGLDQHAKTEKLERYKVTGPFMNSGTYFYSVSGLGAGSMEHAPNYENVK